VTGTPDLRARALELAAGALEAIETSRNRIDDLNVYPVPDGDTGTNLALTVQAVVETLERPGSDDRSTIAHEVSRAALMGARGNSGVILSQIVRGAAESLGASDDLALALRSASDAAYRAVRKPVEGTMLTAIRELADEAERGSGLAAIVARGEDCVARTTGMLPVLAEAGVVDAGAAGLVEILRGIVAALTGTALPVRAPAARVAPSLESIHQELSRYTYCTSLVLEGSGLDAEGLEHELEPLGDSLLVVGDPSALKLHVHTDDPGRVLSVAVAHGTIAGVEIANMRVQTVEREQRLLRAVPAEAPAEGAIVAVAPGEGNRRLLESLGARVVDGGRTMNPSTAEILASIEASGAPSVVVLPNDRNVILAAEHAAAEASRRVAVIPTTTVQAGLAASLAFDPSRPLDENVEAMSVAAADLATGAVTIASRDVETNGLVIRKGAWLGLADGAPVAGGGGFDEVVKAVVARMLEQPREVLTLLAGQEPQPLEGLLAELGATYPGLELDVHEGGQPNYPLWLGAE